MMNDWTKRNAERNARTVRNWSAKNGGEKQSFLLDRTLHGHATRSVNGPVESTQRTTNVNFSRAAPTSRRSVRRTYRDNRGVERAVISRSFGLEENMGGAVGESFLRPVRPRPRDRYERVNRAQCTLLKGALELLTDNKYVLTTSTTYRE